MSSSTRPIVEAPGPIKDTKDCTQASDDLGDLEPYARKLRALEQQGSITLARILRPAEQHPASTPAMPPKG